MKEPEHIPLSKTESLLRDIYHQNENLLRIPFYDDEIHKWACFRDINNLADFGFDNSGIHTFFQNKIAQHPDYNIWANPHPRYFPAVLHSLEQIKIVCTMQGSGEIYINGDKYTQQAGDLCFIAPKTIHSVGVFEDDSLVVNFLMRPSVLNDCFSSLLHRDDILSHFLLTTFYSSSLAPAIIFHTNADPGMKHIIDQIFIEYTHGTDPFTPYMIEAHMMLLLGTLLRNYSDSISAIDIYNRTEDPHLIECIRYLYTNYATTSLNEMADMFHYSPSHLCKIIKQYTGQSFLEFTREKKLNAAQLLLSSSNMPIKDIADKTGFMDISHFYRVFKGKYGKTPLEYRNEHAAAPAG